MQYLRIKINRVARSVINAEIGRLALKFISSNLFLPFWIRQYAILSQAMLPIQTSLSYLHTRCYFTGNPRWTLNYFKMHRMHFKMTAAKAQLVGLSKSSW